MLSTYFLSDSPALLSKSVVSSFKPGFRSTFLGNTCSAKEIPLSPTYFLQSNVRLQFSEYRGVNFSLLGHARGI